MLSLYEFTAATMDQLYLTIFAKVVGKLNSVELSGQINAKVKVLKMAEAINSLNIIDMTQPLK
jgi:hypothetical protein